MSLQPGLPPSGVPAVGAGEGLLLDGDRPDDVPRERDVRRDEDGALVGRADADADAAGTDPDPTPEQVREQAVDEAALDEYADRFAESGVQRTDTDR